MHSVNHVFKLFRLLLLLHLTLETTCKSAKPPHVVVLLADDLGFHDVSWHNREVISPHLDSMAREGVILNRSYVQPTCTPSRSALLTGRYPFKLGTQHGPFGDAQPVGLPTDFTLLPAYLKEVGYKTHLVGKWHLGFCRDGFLPTRRGFDTHYGFLCGYGDHFNHTSYLLTNSSFGGFDFRDNLKKIRLERYSTYAYADRVSSLIRSHDPSRPFFLFYSFQAVHTPLQVPNRFYKMYANVRDGRRRIYLGMMTSLDEAVGRLVRDLKAANMFDDTLFIFSSDNGGQPPFSGASNYPLQGFKDNMWEGGIRVPAFIYSKRHLKKRSRVENGYVHITDWAPTILDLAGYNYRSLKLDGISHARTLLRGHKSHRRSMIVNIDEVTNMATVICGPWKLIVGSPVYHRAYKKHKKVKRDNIKYRLFNIIRDPREQKNVANRHPRLRAFLLRYIKRQKRFLRKSVPRADCPASNPRLFGGFWSPGWCLKGDICMRR